jgi:hypothetical protein
MGQRMYETVRLAMLNKAPGLYRQLEKSGDLEQAIQDRAEEIGQEIVSQTMANTNHNLEGLAKLQSAEQAKRQAREMNDRKFNPASFRASGR